MAQVVQSGFLRAVSLFFEYDTPKIVHIRSKKVGIINRLIQLLILAYIIGYAIVWKKGYQEFDDVVSVSRTKLKGTVFTNTTELPANDPRNRRIWDVSDYVVPAQENDAFFVMTNVVMTLHQSQRTCFEDPTNRAAWCNTTDDCPVGQPVPNGNGVRTGACVDSTDPKHKVCEIHAWCPIENDTLPLGPDRALLADSKNFTVLLKNNIKFPKFNRTKRNILDSQGKDYLKSCRYSKSSLQDSLCPIFELGTIVSEAGQDYEQMAAQGGVIDINIVWDCNLDLSFDDCRPEYKFTRLDPEVAKISPGWNFRYSNYYHENGTQMRDLFKAVGIRYVIKVTGKAGKFSLVPLLLSLGSGMGLLAIATVLCDIVVMYLLKKGNFYKEKKYYYVTDDDAFQGFQSDDDSEDSLVDGQPSLGSVERNGYNSLDEVESPTAHNNDTGNESIKKRRGTPPDSDRDQLVE